MDKPLTESQEDYLEAIYVVSADGRRARSRDLSTALGVKRPSVTTALKTLADKGLIDYAPYGRITLTQAGQTVARGVVARHGILRDFLVNVMGVSPEVAETEACRLEHAFSAPVFARFVRLADTLDRCPDRAIRWDKKRGFACGKRACVDCERKGRGAPSPLAAEGYLKDLEVSQTAVLVGYQGDAGVYRQKLLAMGLTRGVQIRIIKVAPLGDPVEIEVRGFRLTVRKDEADALIVARVAEPVRAGRTAPGAGSGHGRANRGSAGRRGRNTGHP